MRRLVATLALALLLAVAAAVAAPGEKPVVVCQGNLSAAASTESCEGDGLSFPLNFWPSAAPKKLPQRKETPVRASLAGGVRRFVDTSPPPPPLKEAILDFDGNVQVDAEGIPTCKRDLLELIGRGVARRVCRKSMLGVGTAEVLVPSISSQPIKIQLTLFNGGVWHGTTTLFIHSTVAGIPAVAPVKITRIDEGRYGLRAIAKVPDIGDSTGALLEFALTVGGLDLAKPLRGYVSARCFDEHLEAKMAMVFEDGARGSGLAVRACTPRAEPAASSAG